MTRAGDGRRLAPSVVLVGLALMLWSALYATSAEARRIALVIGNGDYVTSGDLHNPANDARAMADKLKSLGFKLVGGQAHVDVNQRGMNTLLRDLEDELASSGAGTTALVFYSGYGVAQDNQTWLVPIDDEAIEYREDVPRFAIGVNSVMRSLERAGGRLHILVLDACWDNLLPSRYGTIGRASKGLPMVPASGKTDQVIVYAAASGGVVYDGPAGGLSPFTKALVDEMDEPGRRLIDVMVKVKDEVKRRTEGLPRGAQVPWVALSMESPFYFVPCPPGSDCPGEPM